MMPSLDRGCEFTNCGVPVPRTTSLGRSLGKSFPKRYGIFLNIFVRRWSCCVMKSLGFTTPFSKKILFVEQLVLLISLVSLSWSDNGWQMTTDDVAGIIEAKAVRKKRHFRKSDVIIEVFGMRRLRKKIHGWSLRNIFSI